MTKTEESNVLPLQTPHVSDIELSKKTGSSASKRGKAVIGLLTLLLAASHWAVWAFDDKETERVAKTNEIEPFYHLVKSHDDLCVGGVSHSGYVGLKGDNEEEPRRSFFWYFEAQNNPETAPVILTIGGGPGTSGMSNPLFGQSHCKIIENATSVPNPNAWTENYNLVALDHPIGVGFSYGTGVNNSRAAAYDAYDFLVKFFSLFPHLAKNKLVLAGGSYGGIYVPHIATVIHEQNTALANGGGAAGAKHLNFESMMLSNPMSDLLSHNRWMLQQRCYYTDFYNSTVCEAAYERMPFCLEAIQMAYMQDSHENRRNALRVCNTVNPNIIEGRSLENVEMRCNGTIEDCIPQSVWAAKFMNTPETKAKLGVRLEMNFTFVNRDVWEEFKEEGDMVQQSYLLYEPLLKAGYRLLHYIGKVDANCGWPGVLSMLKLIRSQYQSNFIVSPDVPWKGENATVRVVGEGAGNFTYVLMDGAGHFVTRDQPEMVKKVIGHWIENVPFV